MNPNDANDAGIGMVHQHFKLVHNMTVLENIVLGVESVRRGVLRMDEARARVMALSERYGFAIDRTPGSRTPPWACSSGWRSSRCSTRQRGADLRRAHRGFDAPGDRGFDAHHAGLAAEGKSILFISQKLAEIKELADRCTVLRKGRLIGTVSVADVSKEDLSEMMVGRKVNSPLKRPGPRRASRC